jgi:hypothetical protein
MFFIIYSTYKYKYTYWHEGALQHAAKKEICQNQVTNLLIDQLTKDPPTQTNKPTNMNEWINKPIERSLVWQYECD